ncbi:MAG: hypothetical protein MJZ14_08725 [Paludibacteraceae bacterium]|nr:hypothetical protein [Paludibacteraceae bacterium]
MSGDTIFFCLLVIFLLACLLLPAFTSDNKAVKENKTKYILFTLLEIFAVGTVSNIFIFIGVMVFFIWQFGFGLWPIIGGFVAAGAIIGIIQAIYVSGREKFADPLPNLPSVSYTGNKVGFFDSLDKGSHVRSFAYKDGVVTMEMQNGNSFSGKLTTMDVSFITNKFTGYVSNAKIKFWDMDETVYIIPSSDVLPFEAWSQIYEILSHAGKVDGTPKLERSAVDNLKLSASLMSSFHKMGLF